MGNGNRVWMSLKILIQQNLANGNSTLVGPSQKIGSGCTASASVIGRIGQVTGRSYNPSRDQLVDHATANFCTFAPSPRFLVGAQKCKKLRCT